jgi:hypothetical protein
MFEALGWICSATKTNKQTQKIISFDKNVEKFESLCTVGEKVRWCSHCGKQCGRSSKLKVE